jgi:hypothetical protein
VGGTYLEHSLPNAEVKKAWNFTSTVTQAFIASCLIKHTCGMTFEKRFRVMTIAMNYAKMAVNWARRLPLNFGSEMQVSKVGNRKRSN